MGLHLRGKPVQLPGFLGYTGSGSNRKSKQHNRVHGNHAWWQTRSDFAMRFPQSPPRARRYVEHLSKTGRAGIAAPRRIAAVEAPRRALHQVPVAERASARDTHARTVHDCSSLFGEKGAMLLHCKTVHERWRDHKCTAAAASARRATCDGTARPSTRRCGRTRASTARASPSGR